MRRGVSFPISSSSPPFFPHSLARLVLPDQKYLRILQLLDRKTYYTFVAAEACLSSAAFRKILFSGLLLLLRYFCHIHLHHCLLDPFLTFIGCRTSADSPSSNDPDVRISSIHLEVPCFCW